MTPQLNVTFNPSSLPSWLIGLFLLALTAAETWDRWPKPVPPAITLVQCLDACNGNIAVWSASECTCQPYVCP